MCRGELRVDLEALLLQTLTSLVCEQNSVKGTFVGKKKSVKGTQLCKRTCCLSWDKGAGSKDKNVMKREGVILRKSELSIGLLISQAILKTEKQFVCAHQKVNIVH